MKQETWRKFAKGTKKLHKLDCKNLLKKARSLEKNAATLNICEIWGGGRKKQPKIKDLQKQSKKDSWTPPFES